MICSWCYKNEVEFELVINKLKQESTNVANGNKTAVQFVREKQLSVRLCENCLPVTSTKNLNRYKLRGKEIEGSK